MILFPRGGRYDERARPLNSVNTERLRTARTGCNFHLRELRKLHINLAAMGSEERFGEEDLVILVTRRMFSQAPLPESLRFTDALLCQATRKTQDEGARCLS